MLSHMWSLLFSRMQKCRRYLIRVQFSISTVINFESALIRKHLIRYQLGANLGRKFCRLVMFDLLSIGTCREKLQIHALVFESAKKIASWTRLHAHVSRLFAQCHQHVKDICNRFRSLMKPERSTLIDHATWTIVYNKSSQPILNNVDEREAERKEEKKKSRENRK